MRERGQRPAAWDLTTNQIGYGRIQAQATDQPTCGSFSSRSSGGKYYYYHGVRVPPDYPRRSCADPADPRLQQVLLIDFREESGVKTLYFRFGVQIDAEGGYFGGPPPEPDDD